MALSGTQTSESSHGQVPLHELEAIADDLKKIEERLRVVQICNPSFDSVPAEFVAPNRNDETQGRYWPRFQKPMKNKTRGRRLLVGPTTEESDLIRQRLNGQGLHFMLQLDEIADGIIIGTGSGTDNPDALDVIGSEDEVIVLEAGVVQGAVDPGTRFPVPEDHQLQVQNQNDYRLHPAWHALLILDRVRDLVFSESHINPSQPHSDVVQKDNLLRPIYNDEWLHFPFSSVMLPVDKLVLGDSVLVSLNFSGDISLSGIIKAGPGAIFGSGPNRKTILSHQVELEIVSINPDHRNVRLLDDCTMPGVELVGHLHQRRSWLFPLTAILFISLDRIRIPVLSNSRLLRHF